MKEGRDITTNFREIKRIMRGYYDQLYTKKLDNVDERDTFLEIKLLWALNEMFVEPLL